MIDLVIGLECTSSMESKLGQVRNLIISTLDPILAQNPNTVRMSLVQFPSRAPHDNWMTNTFTCTQDINTFEQWLTNTNARGGSEDGCEAIGDALKEAMNILQHRHVSENNEELSEKLVVLITDGPPNGLFNLLDSDRFTQLKGADPWLMADKFNRLDVSLVVVGSEPNILSCDDFYCALTRKTGGLYIPLTNAKSILSSVIQTVISEEDTFHQAFLRIKTADIEQNSKFNYSAMQHRVNGMLTECQTLDDIKRRFFHR